jgi:hypothetical protein
LRGNKKSSDCSVVTPRNMLSVRALETKYRNENKITPDHPATQLA